MGLLAACVLGAVLARESLLGPTEKADALDTHRQRMLLDLHDGILDEVIEAKAWALQNIDGGTERHASAYLNYHKPSGHSNGKIRAWYHTVVPKHSADDTYFAVQGTQFGYMGLQQVRDSPYFEGKVVFSLWDQPDDTPESEDDVKDEDKAEVVECGHLAICTRFGGEGTGAKSYINFNHWSLEHEYGFLTIAEDIGEGRVRYDGYIWGEELGGWQLVSKIEVRRGAQPWDINRMYSFTEQWTTRDFGESRWQKLGPSFVQFDSGKDGDLIWTQIRHATFSHTVGQAENTEHVNANVTNNDTQWGLGVGGNVSEGKVKVLIVDQADDIPEQINKFDELMRNKELPGGCEGQTCDTRWWISVFREAAAPSHLPLTCTCSALVVLASCLFCFALCPLCSQKQEQESLLECREQQSP